MDTTKNQIPVSDVEASQRLIDIAYEPGEEDEIAFATALYDHLTLALEDSRVGLMPQKASLALTEAYARFSALLRLYSGSVETMLRNQEGETAFITLSNLVQCYAIYKTKQDKAISLREKEEMVKLKLYPNSITSQVAINPTKEERKRQELIDALDALTAQVEDKEDYSGWEWDKVAYAFVFVPFVDKEGKNYVCKYSFGPRGCNCKTKKENPESMCKHERRRSFEASR